MFSRTAHLYDAIYSFKDYAAEAATVRELVRERVPGARALLDVACGTGKHLGELRAWFEVEGVDLDPALLAVARERLPDVPLHEGDLVELDLGREFDVVTCLFSSIGYVVTRERLAAACAALARHVAPGGLLVVEPWLTPDVFVPHVGAVFVDEPELKIARMDAVGEPTDPLVLEMHYLVGTPAGIEHLVEPLRLEPGGGPMGRGLMLGRRGA